MRNRPPENWPVTREYTRFLIDLRIVIRTSTRLYGRSKDLGEGGMGATVAGDLSIGEVVEVEFEHPEIQEPLALMAEVRYRQGFQYGLKFIDPSHRQREMIRRITRNLPMMT